MPTQIPTRFPTVQSGLALIRVGESLQRRSELSEGALRGQFPVPRPVSCDSSVKDRTDLVPNPPLLAVQVG
jgi:hypothetical protein